MEMLGKVRRMFYREKQSRSEIARRTGLSPNTVKIWLGVPERTAPKYRRQSAPRKLSPLPRVFVTSTGNGCPPTQARPANGQGLLR